MSRRQKATKLGITQNEYFIAKILAPCPFEFKKEDGVWYKRKKKSRGEWQMVW